MKDTRSIDEILKDFDPSQTKKEEDLRGGMVGIWLPAQHKVRYDKLQETSGRQFSKKAREVLLALIDAAEAMTA